MLFLSALAQEDINRISGEDMKNFADAIKTLAETQSSQGEWSINGAAFIITSIVIIFTLAFVFGILIRSILSQQKQFTEKILSNNDLISKFKESFDQNTDILGRVSQYLDNINSLSEEKAKREVTSEQVFVLLKWALESAKRKTELETEKIILANNIKDRQRIRDKIKSLVKNIHSDLSSGFNSFDLNGNKIGDLILDNDFLEQKQNIISDYIYSIDDEGNRNRDKFSADLDILFETISNKFKNKLAIS